MPKLNLLPFMTACWLLCFCSQSLPAEGARSGTWILNSLPGPELFPVNRRVDREGNEFLEFSWRKPISIDTNHYIFKVYKGYNTTKSYLVIRQEFPYTVYPIRINSALFERGKLYTWSLTRVLHNGIKSETSYSSFRSM